MCKKEPPAFISGSEKWEEFCQERVKVVKTFKTAISRITPTLLIDAFAKVEYQDCRVNAVLMNAVDYADVRKWGRDLVDFETLTGNLQKGIMAMIWGAMIVVNRRIPTGTIAVLSEDDQRVISIIHLNEKTVSGADELIKLQGDIKTMAVQLHNIADRMLSSVEELVTKVVTKVE